MARGPEADQNKWTRNRGGVLPGRCHSQSQISHSHSHSQSVLFLKWIERTSALQLTVEVGLELRAQGPVAQCSFFAVFRNFQFPLISNWLHWQGLHRSIAQIKERAPNSSPAYISTETRLPAFHKLFESPLAVQELAARHADLDSGQAVAQAVAMLVGGKSCRAAAGIKHSELVNFLYHGAFKFSRGETAKEVLPQSVADKLRRQKHLALDLDSLIN